MKKKCRAILVSLLAICMCITLLPVNVYAGGGGICAVRIESGDMIPFTSSYYVEAYSAGYSVLDNETPVSKWGMDVIQDGKHTYKYVKQIEVLKGAEYLVVPYELDGYFTDFKITGKGGVSVGKLQKTKVKGKSYYQYKCKLKITGDVGDTAQITLKWKQEEEFQGQIRNYDERKVTLKLKIVGKSINAPQSLKVSKAGTTKATLTWKKVKNATGYEVYRSDSKNGTYKKVTTISKAATVKYTDKKGLKKGKTYYYKVRAYNKVKGKKNYSNYSSVKSVKLK